MSTTAAAKEGPAPKSGPGFQQRLGLFDATMLIVGTMIGSGIFVTSAESARDVGSAGWLLVVWGLAGFMTIIGALSYAELAGMMPLAGGQYVYLREAYSPLWGFLYGWTCFLVIQTGSIAAVGVAFAKFLGVLVPALGTDSKDPAVQVIYQLKEVNLKMWLPLMEEPFFEMRHFTITAGQLVAVAVVAFLTLLNCRGVQEGKVVQNIFTVAKTLALIALIVLGLTVAVSPEAWARNTSELWSGIEQTKGYQEWFGKVGMLAVLMVVGGAMVGPLFSSDAWNNITFTAGEIRNPRRNLPLSLALGTSTVIVLYMLANFAYVRSLPVVGVPANDPKLQALEQSAAQREQAGKPTEASEAERVRIIFERGISHAKDDRVGTAVLEMLSPQFGAPIMAIAIMISTFGCVNGMVLMGARLYYVMAQDGLFFKSVGSLNARGVPAVGLILQGIWSILLVFSGTYSELIDYVIFAVLMFYVLTVTGLFILRRTMPNAERPYRAIGYPVLPAVYVLLCAAIMLALLIVKPKLTWPGFIIVLTGIPVYFLWRAFGRRATA